MSACLQACCWRDPQRLGGIGARHWSRGLSRRLLADSDGSTMIGSRWIPVLGLEDDDDDEDDMEEE